MAVRSKSGTWGSMTFSDAPPKKTRQGKGRHTKFGTKPQTHLGAVPKKTLNRYKKRR